MARYAIPYPVDTRVKDQISLQKLPYVHTVSPEHSDADGTTGGGGGRIPIVRINYKVKKKKERNRMEHKSKKRKIPNFLSFFSDYKRKK